MGQPKISLRGIDLAFPNPQTGVRHAALAGVHLDVDAGEFVSLIGPSGCGKTTCINVVAGFLKPDAGEVLIDGSASPGMQGNRIAMMFARDSLLPWRTAAGNVQVAMEFARRRPDRRRVSDFLDMVGLAGYQDFYPGQLSHGMRQRVALARTLASDREILLMDEPFAALDAQTKTLMEGEFSRIWEADRKTVVLVTHDLMEAIALSDRVVVMSPRPGRIKSEHRIDIPRPRDVLELHSDHRFLELYRRLWDELKVELAPVGG